MQNFDKLYINGQWTASTDPGFIEVTGAISEEVIGRVPCAVQEDVDKAVAAGRAAFEPWAATGVAERAAFLTKLHQGLVERGDDIASTVTAEVGMPLKFSQRIQAGLPAAVMQSYAAMIVDHPLEERIGTSLVLHEPVGVVACITPWNYPLHQIVAKVAPALAAGCCVVVKPSSDAPLSGFILAEIVDKAGLPPGVFNLVSGRGATVGEALASHRDVDMVSFTGSTAVGKRLSILAAETIKRVSLELGGKSASVILDDADLTAAVKGSLAACLLNSGQTCSAHTRMLVPESLYEKAASLAVEVAKTYAPADPYAERTRLGPLVSAAQRERVRKYIRSGVEEGAELLFGGVDVPEGLEKGFYVSPTVFGRVDPSMTIAREEIFGPVLSIISYRDEEEAVRIANDTIYGLAGGVWSGDEERAVRFARRMRTGQVDINGAPFNIFAPFGGYKQSGTGRELGRYGLEEFLEVKSIQFKA
jgi:acyl-CoA reductase-like NAD-dependent aldehyde dehydrogenase